MTTPQIDSTPLHNEYQDVIDTRTPISWDSTVYELLFTESATDQLRATNNDPIALLACILDDRTTRGWIVEIANEHDCEPSDVIRSISRTLHHALRD